MNAQIKHYDAACTLDVDHRDEPVFRCECCHHSAGYYYEVYRGAARQTQWICFACAQSQGYYCHVCGKVKTQELFAVPCADCQRRALGAELAHRGQQGDRCEECGERGWEVVEVCPDPDDELGYDRVMCEYCAAAAGHLCAACGQYTYHPVGEDGRCAYCAHLGVELAA